MNICLFTSEEIKNPLSTADERGQHLIKVLHKKAGESFSAGVIGGKAGKANVSGRAGCIGWHAALQHMSHGKRRTERISGYAHQSGRGARQRCEYTFGRKEIVAYEERFRFK